MDLLLSTLRIPVEKDGRDEYLKAAARRLNLSEHDIAIVKILNKALDASAAEQFYYDLSLVVRIPDSYGNKDNLPHYSETKAPDRKSTSSRQRPVIIGFGPAGMFAALELIDRGIQPLIFERGKKIEERTVDVQRFLAERKLDAESNIQFGEGGAGAYSDGKLFSRVNNSGFANRVLDTFIAFGAPEEIGYIRKPHVGTDVLCRIVANMRRHILERGGEIRYSSKMTDVLISEGEVRGVVINGEKQYLCSSLYLAIGNSSRDTFELLHKKGIALEQKQISVGLRVEHPAEKINLLRYGAKYRGFPGLGAAAYSFTHTDRAARRGVYSFCMCPGGEVINASSENGLLVVNGMSYAGRASAFSNSAIVVTCHTGDYAMAGPLAGFEFQRGIERKAFAAAGGGWRAPAQNLSDFLCGRVSKNLNANSYKMGVVSVDLHEVLPGFVCGALVQAFTAWKEECPLFVSEDGIVLGAETRTSCPVRVIRSETYESVAVKNLYPIGEGSGYSGGITSSAIDAIKAVAARFGS
ncbi:MAG: dehydrogenase [Deltaproteobacteria bacterium]|nr:dehydrogenase [Deltaproteobacteria bacterium]